jgi:hypothetical protein
MWEGRCWLSMNRWPVLPGAMASQRWPFFWGCWQARSAHASCIRLWRSHLVHHLLLHAQQPDLQAATGLPVRLGWRQWCLLHIVAVPHS